MAHYVICQYCNGSFDRDVHPYVQPSSRRYGHSECYLRARETNPNQKELTIYDPNDIITCCVCKQKFNKKLAEYVQLGTSKYAHKKCAELEEKREKTDSEKLDDYICKLFKIDYVTPRIRKQINEYITKYNYSYTGILKSLKYFYEIHNNDLSKAQGGIGIVPYVYQKAYTYYYSLWQSEENNKEKDITKLINKTIEITIPPPQRNIQHKKKFTFLEEELNEQ